MYDQYKQHPNHFYIEPPSAVEAILKCESFHGGVHDPACGSGTIPRMFHSRGYQVSCSDIIQRFHGSDLMTFNFQKRDFLSNPAPTTSYDNIISNPPYNLAEEFVVKALDCVNFKVAFLLRLAFLEGQGRASRIFNGRTPLKTVYVFPNRVNMPPGDLLQQGKVKREGGKHAFAWFVFDTQHTGDPSIKWLPVC